MLVLNNAEAIYGKVFIAIKGVSIEAGAGAGGMVEWSAAGRRMEQGGPGLGAC
jgi:hypothetical protein